MIARQALAPNAIAEHLDKTRQAGSEHLRILTECELVTQGQKGLVSLNWLVMNITNEIFQW